jgi:hypothetical protein
MVYGLVSLVKESALERKGEAGHKDKVETGKDKGESTSLLSTSFIANRIVFILHSKLF